MAEIDENGDIDGLAAEYVLGTLSASERADVERRLRLDPQLAKAIGDWEERFDPLLDKVAPVEPPADSFAAIRARIASPLSLTGSGEAGPADIVQLRQRLRRWRNGAVGAMAIAASLMLFIGVREFARPPGEQFVAVLEGDDRNPAFVAAVNTADKSIMVLRMGAQLAPAADRSHELWAIGGDDPRPRSLGLLDTSSRIPAERLGEFRPGALQGTTFAVSLEPKGGSPTGQPTGPVVFTGKLVPVPGK